MTRRRRLPKPERFLAPVSAAVLLLLAWTAVAHASGSGWVQAVGSLAAGLVVVGMVTPAFVARRLSVTCVAAPRDAVSGEPLVLELISNRALRATPLFPRGQSVVVSGSTPARLELRPPYRGVLGAVDLRLATAAPLGLLWWSVDRTVSLPVPVHIAPNPSVPAGVEIADPRVDPGRGRPVPALSGEMRGVRDYQHGDGPRLVHWRATAHTSRLMVREVEEQPDQASRVVAHLPNDPVEADTRAAEALATVLALLAAGRRVTFVTTEYSSTVSGPVSDRARTARRLARAGVNPYESGRRQQAGRRRRPK
jgi:uncharacterized protein (DUF58 family)